MNPNLRYRGSGFGNEETQKVKRLLAEELSREDDEIESKPLRYLDSALWLVGSGMALYYTDFFRRIFTDPTVKFYWFYSGLVLLSIHIGIGLYLILFIGSEKWDTETRFSIPVATVTALVSFFCFVVGLWPLWGLLTPLLLFTFVMGVVTVVSLLPGRERSEKNKTELEKL